jgi:hypothetical protein
VAIKRAFGVVAIAADSLIVSHVNCRNGPMAAVPSRSRRQQLLDSRRLRELAERRREVRVIGLHDPGLAVGQVGRRPEQESLAAGLDAETARGLPPPGGGGVRRPLRRGAPLAAQGGLTAPATRSGLAVGLGGLADRAQTAPHNRAHAF